MKRIGIFGGTFNPIHKAHIRIAAEFADQAALDLCIFVPAFISPFKADIEPLVDPNRRIEMIEIAIKSYPNFEVDSYEVDSYEIDRYEIDRYEIDNKRISYTYQTIEHISSKYSDSELFLLIGGDNVNDFKKWRKWEEILSYVTLCIAKRPGSFINNNIITSLESYGRVKILDTSLYDLSSSDIRMRLAKNLDCKDYLDQYVLEYIKSNKLYQ